MRFFALIPALAALITSVAAAPVPVDTSCGLEMGCGDVTSKRDFLEHPSRTTRGMTNAELLRRGLPLKNPVMRRGTPARRSRPSSVPSSVPPVTVTHRGVIEVRNSATNALLGYVAQKFVNQGAQSGYDPSIANALTVSFTTDVTGSGSKLDITAANSDPSWPLLGLIQGRDDTDSNLDPTTYKYLYIGGIANPGTQPGDTPTTISNSYFIGPARTAESAVWTFDPTSGLLTPQWINTDGSAPAEQFWTQSNGLYVGGSQSLFQTRYPAPVTPINFHFVPA